MQIDEKLLDALAIGEVNALLEGLEDPELRRNPAFLAKVREFLKQNKLQTTPETEGVSTLKKVNLEEIPTFDFDGQVLQ